MHRSIRLAAASLFAVGLLVFTPVQAQAHTEACVGTGTMTLSTSTFNALGWTGAGSGSFAFNYTVGVCSTSSTLTASGLITGTCGLSSGSGTANGHPFVFENVGTVLVASGSFSGVFSLVEDPTDSGSCVNNTSTRFLLTGIAVAT